MVIPDLDFVDKYGTKASRSDSARFRTFNKKTANKKIAKSCNHSAEGKTMSLVPFPQCKTIKPTIQFLITTTRLPHNQITGTGRSQESKGTVNY